MASSEKLGLNIALGKVIGQVAKTDKIFYTTSGFASAKTIFCYNSYYAQSK